MAGTGPPLAPRPAFGSSLRVGSVQASFDPGSVTFISLQTGWVLGTAPCASGRECLALRETTDAGRAWSARPLPASLLAAADRLVGGVPAAVHGMAGLNVRFADRRDGWIYGSLAVTTGSYRPTLWSTHDGGLVWREQPLPGLGLDSSIFDLQAAAGTAYQVQSSPPRRDRQELPRRAGQVACCQHRAPGPASRWGSAVRGDRPSR